MNIWLCLPTRRHLSEVRDGHRLPLLLGLYVDLHRAVCPMCRRFERSLEATQQAARALRDLPFEERNEEPSSGDRAGDPRPRSHP